MPNGVHAPVNGVQPAPPHLPIDGGLAKAQRHELSARNNPVLPLGKVCDRPVEGVLCRLTAYCAVK
jgi:hypothetical protein